MHATETFIRVTQAHISRVHRNTGYSAHARVDFVTKHSKRSQPAAQQLTDSGPLGDAVISGRWLVKAIVFFLVLSAVALYLTICGIFYQEQWRVTFSPPQGKSPSVASVAAQSGLPIANTSFDTTEEGVEQLNGWWIPSDASLAAKTEQSRHAASDKFASMVLLYCPNGRTDLSTNVDALQAFHKLGVSVFAFDYRGFGASQRGQPSQKKAYADGIAALHYLTGIRHIDPGHIVIYGEGLGSAVAATVARHSPQIAGIILENPQPSLTQQVKREERLPLLPVSLLLRDKFDISNTVPSLAMPKLILVNPTPPEYIYGAAKIYAATPAPKQKVQLPPHSGVPAYNLPQWNEAVRKFLGMIVAHPSN